MKKVLLILLAIIGALALMLAFAAAGISLISMMGKGRVPGKTILEVDFEKGLIEYAPDDPFSKLFGEEVPVVRDVVDALEKGAGDDRVVGLIARVGVAPMGLAQIQEVRDALEAFRESGKPAVAFSETFGEVGPGNGAYYLATAFDEIYLQPSGDVGLTGLVYETPFLRGTLEKLGMEPRMDHRKEYKNAKNIYTEREYTDAHREATQVMMDSHFRQMVRGIGEGRGMTEEEVGRLINGGPFYGAEAVEKGLVDGLRYRDEVYDMIKERTDETARVLFLDKYLARAGRPHRRGETVALIFGLGAVTRGKSEFDPLFGESTMGSDTVAGAFRSAIRADDVKAIIFRVDSPGGSYVASDAIWRETLRARDAGKPVIVTMGNVAASGGYFVSMSADKIVAQPGTITASIGVLGGKILTSGFWNKLGLSWDEVHTSTNATIWSGTHDYSKEEWRRFQAWLDRVYDDFTGKVAEGREIPKEKVLGFAKGRVWTGEDALRLGLVDELGGYAKATELAREAAGLDPDAEIRLRIYPKPRSPLEKLFAEGPDSSEPRADLVVLARALEIVRPAARLARRLGLFEEPGVLVAPVVEAEP